MVILIFEIWRQLQIKGGSSPILLLGFEREMYAYPRDGFIIGLGTIVGQNNYTGIGLVWCACLLLAFYCSFKVPLDISPLHSPLSHRSLLLS